MLEASSATYVEQEISKLCPDVITIDFFDTLVFRSLAPHDALIERVGRAILTSEPEVKLFARERRNAERILSKAAGSRDTSLADIYLRIKLNQPSLSRHCAQLCSAEISLEQKAWEPNDALMSVLNAARRRCKLIVLSDTYLPSHLLSDWLAGRLPVNEVITSSEMQATKRSGRLFRKVKSRYPQSTILHIGDNPSVDSKAESFGFHTILYADPLSYSSLLPQESRDLAVAAETSVGLSAIRGAFPQSPQTAVWAFSWAQVIMQFVRSAINFAKASKVDQVFLLGRDCESIFQALHSFFDEHGLSVRYLQVSRRSLAPLASRAEYDDEQLKLCREYLSDKLKAGARRVLIVDVGWKGGMQDLITKGLPSSVEVLGFYFSMEPRAARDKRTRAACFLPWDRGVFNQAITEFLFGFLEETCVGYKRVGSTVEPITGGNPCDVSDYEYTICLRAVLTSLSESSFKGEIKYASSQTVSRAVARLQMYPRVRDLRVIAKWNIGSQPDASNVERLDAPSAGWIKTVFLVDDEHNLWPSARVALRIKSRFIYRVAQQAAASRWSLISGYQRWRHRPLAPLWADVATSAELS